jgi:hypothetical protein
MRAYGQAHDTPAGKMCWMGRIDRATALAAQQTDEVSKKRMQNALTKLIALAQADFIEGERAHADYVDLCAAARVEPQKIEVDCQCENCQRVPKFSEQLFAAEVIDNAAD